MTSAELVDRIYATATRLGDSKAYGHGLLNFAYAAGEVRGPVVSINPDDYSTEPVVDPDPIDLTFDINSYDVRINTYKTQLSLYCDIAYQNGDIELSKEIDREYQKLLYIDSELHILPDEYAESKETADYSSSYGQI